MEYLVHVIDNSSQHSQKENFGGHEIVEGKSENGFVGEVVRSSQMYLVEEDEAIDTVVTISGIIRIKDSNDEIVFLSEMFQRESSRYDSSSMDSDSFISPQTSNLEVVENSKTEVIKTSFSIERSNGEEKWIELHEFQFYITPRDEIIYIKAEKD
jgi:hypothetical protein